VFVLIVPAGLALSVVAPLFLVAWLGCTRLPGRSGCAADPEEPVVGG
jgi:hypothetical protein